MNTLIWCLIAVNFAASALFAWRHFSLRKEMDAARKQLDQWGAAGLGTLPASVYTALGRPALISVEILNPMELAMRDSPLAKTFGSLTPDLVRREVYKEVYRRLSLELQEHGVVAEVRLHDGA